MAVRDWRLTGANPLAYMGVNAGSPPNIKEYDRAPKTTDNKGYIIGDLWLDTNASPQNLWILVSLVLGVATWLDLGLGAAAESFPTDAGTAIPVAGVLNILSGTGTLTSGAGNTVTVYADGDVATTYNADTGNAKPTINTLNVFGGTGIATTGAAATLTLDVDGDVATSYAADVGTAVPALNVLTVAGGTNCTTAAAGSTVTVNVTAGAGLLNAGENLNEAPAGTVNLNQTIHWPDTNTAGTTGVIYLGGAGGVGGNKFLHNYGVANTFTGENSGNFTLTGTTNCGYGVGVLGDLTSGDNNSGYGEQALADCTTGDHNNAFGNGAAFRLTTGDENISIGNPSLEFLLSGNYNIGIGNHVGMAYTTSESSNILIGNLGVVGESNKLRIGRHGSGNWEQNKCFIAGIRGITTEEQDAIPVLIDSAHQLGTVSSSIRYKQNIEDMDTESDDLLKLRPVTFEYKERPGIMQYGLIAEEVEEIMPRLVVKDAEGIPEAVKYHEMPSILLHAIQKLVTRVDELEQKILA